MINFFKKKPHIEKLPYKLVLERNMKEIIGEQNKKYYQDGFLDRMGGLARANLSHLDDEKAAWYELGYIDGRKYLT